MGELIVAQLTDPFRWALLVGLVWTMRRNEAVTGRWLPLAAGAAFVALIIPLTTGAGAGAGFAPLVIAGLAANAAILAVVLGVWALVARARG